jgi:photosystem II stability/assembly factor-like uncharacterized protein
LTLLLRCALLALACLLMGPAFADEPAARIEAVASSVKVRLRGLFAVSDAVVWASGREGTVLRTLDGGQHWSVFRIAGAEALDFRDVHAFDAEQAVVMSAGPGEDSRVYRTADGGRSWALVLRNPDVDGFFDCMDFGEGEGRLLGDPVRGRFQVFASHDGGRSWAPTQGPRALEKEAAFAASGTCLRRVHAGTVVVTGGSHARVLFSPDRLGGEWRALELREFQPAESSGLFSIAQREGLLLAVGGDFKREGSPSPLLGAAADAQVSRSGMVYAQGAPYLAHDGNDMKLSRVLIRDRWYDVNFDTYDFASGVPRGYRSAIACEDAERPFCIATGQGGSDLLGPTRTAREVGAAERAPIRVLTAEEIAAVPLDGLPRPLSVQDFGVASEWVPLTGPGYDAVSIAGHTAWFSGAEGRLGRMRLPSVP